MELHIRKCLSVTGTVDSIRVMHAKLSRRYLVGEPVDSQSYTQIEDFEEVRFHYVFESYTQMLLVEIQYPYRFLIFAEIRFLYRFGVLKGFRYRFESIGHAPFDWRAANVSILVRKEDQLRNKSRYFVGSFTKDVRAEIFLRGEGLLNL